MIEFTEHWNKYLEAIPAHLQDLYFREEYVRLYETESEKACCFVYQNNDSVLLFPFLRREFQFKGNTYFDFETAYGYGGPISNDHSDTFMTAALQAMSEKASSENYVCGFVRFHPLLENWDCFEKSTGGLAIMDRKTIAIDLTGGIESTWMNEIHTKNRNVIKKGEKNGLEFIVDEDFAYLTEFEELYNSTMDKLEADGFYYFDPGYYDQLKNTIQNRFLGIVKHEGKVVAGVIFFCFSFHTGIIISQEATNQHCKALSQQFPPLGGCKRTDKQRCRILSSWRRNRRLRRKQSLSV